MGTDPGAGRAGKACAFVVMALVAGADPAATHAQPASGAAVAGSLPTQAVGDEGVAGILLRVAGYVADYEQAFSDLVAEETYTQQVEGYWTGTYYTYSATPANTAAGGVPIQFANKYKRQQVTRADLVFVRLAGPLPWASYRDVFEVDGKKVRDHEQRLLALFSKPAADVHDQARALLNASAKYNIGRVTRTMNLPTLPLLFLSSANQPRFRFELGPGRQTIAATDTVELLFREVARPTLVAGPKGSDLPTSGKFLVNPTRGAVVSSEVRLDFGPEAEAVVTTAYRPEPALAMWVPVEMKERYADAPKAKVRVFPDAFTGVARYSRFRKFTVSSQEKLDRPQ